MMHPLGFDKLSNKKNPNPLSLLDGEIYMWRKKGGGKNIRPPLLVGGLKKATLCGHPKYL